MRQADIFQGTTPSVQTTQRHGTPNSFNHNQIYLPFPHHHTIQNGTCKPKLTNLYVQQYQIESNHPSTFQKQTRKRKLQEIQSENNNKFPFPSSDIYLSTNTNNNINMNNMFANLYIPQPPQKKQKLSFIPLHKSVPYVPPAPLGLSMYLKQKLQEIQYNNNTYNYIPSNVINNNVHYTLPMPIHPQMNNTNELKTPSPISYEKK
eukprot:279147_1